MYNYTQEKKKKKKRTLSHKQVYIMRIFRVLQNHILPLNFSQKILLAHQFFFVLMQNITWGRKRKAVPQYVKRFDH